MPKRIFSILFCFCFLFVCFLGIAPSVSAAVYEDDNVIIRSWEDYVSGVTVNGTTGIVYFELDVSDFYVYAYDGSHVLFDVHGEDVVLGDFSVDNYVELLFSPFSGTYDGDGGIAPYYFLDISGLPDKTSFYIELDVSCDAVDTNVVEPIVHMVSYDKVSQTIQPLWQYTGDFYVEDMTGYDYLNFSAYFAPYVYDVSNPGENISFFMRCPFQARSLRSAEFYVYFECTIPDYVVSNDEVFRGEVLKQLSEQGMTLDDILESQDQTNDKLDGIQDTLDDVFNSPADPVTPSGSDKVDAVEKQESEILADMQQNWEQSQLVFDEFDLLLVDYQPAFLAVSGLINDITAIPWLRSILIFSLALGILAVLLNIGLSIASAISNRHDRGGGKRRD